MSEIIGNILLIYVMLGSINMIITGIIVDRHRKKNWIQEPDNSIKGMFVMLLFFIFWPVLLYSMIRYWNK